MAKRWVVLATAALAAFSLSACGDERPTRPIEPSMVPNQLLTGAITDEYAGGPVHGAIFTTTPNGGVVNANVQYTQKIEVYLDGGPRNANSAAAGLNDGLYVFQITDPPGKNLLSQDPARCRVVQVKGGVILGTVAATSIPGLGAKTDNWSDKVPDKNNPCHIEGPELDGLASTAARHDTNKDTDLGGGMTVQMMPFLDTPNNGGVYKAWITPLAEYAQKSGGIANLNTVPSPARGQTTGNIPDKGFANPSRNNVKTDNFKVIENPPFIEIVKYNTDTKQQEKDWPILVIDPVDGGEGGGNYSTPTRLIGIPLNTPVKVCEEARAGWAFVSVKVGDGPEQTGIQAESIDGKTYYCVSVTATTSGTITIAFSNRPEKPKARISIGADGVNEVGKSHPVTGTVLVDADDGKGEKAAPDGTSISFEIQSGPGKLDAASCVTINSTGACTVKLTSLVAGTTKVIAKSTIKVGSSQTEFNLVTNGVAPNSGPLTKQWVDASIAITPPKATNPIGVAHVFTIKVTANPAGATPVVIGLPKYVIAPKPKSEVLNCSAQSGNTRECTLTINSDVVGSFTVNASADVEFGTTAPNYAKLTRDTDPATTIPAGPDGSGPAVKDYVNATITIEPPLAVNEVGANHTFKVTVKSDVGAGLKPVAGVKPTVAITPPGFTLVEDKCATPGTDANGVCTVTIKSGPVAKYTATASLSLTVTTANGSSVFALKSGDAVKHYVDANIGITPATKTNGITEDHTFAVAFTALPGAATPVTFVSIVPSVEAPAGFVLNVDYTTSNDCATFGVAGNVATCSVKLNSKKAGKFIAKATGKVTIGADQQAGGVLVVRTTDGSTTPSGAKNSVPAEKIYITGSLSWVKIDGATPPRLLLGATFQVRRTHDRFGVAVTTPPAFSVTDNVAPDVDGLAGKFKVTGLPLGRYCIKETAAPAGYLLDPVEQCGIELTLTAPDQTANPFVNSLQGRMTGGSGQIEVTLPNGDIVSLTSGFTIHCDIVLSNNLEINWPANKWHITKPITSATCIDDPNVIPDQPNAPFDTFIGTADGELNGVGISKILFTFVDGDGSPGGKANDRASMTIWDAQGKVVLSFKDLPIRGNLQAHDDQPHKNP